MLPSFFLLATLSFLSLGLFVFVLKKFNLIVFLILSAFAKAHAQTAFSITTDASLLRNFTKGQVFTTIGQSVTANFHVNKKETVYAGISYYVNGNYNNPLIATEKDTSGSTTTLNYTSSSTLGYRQTSIGWKHFFLGTFDNEESVNIYGTAGFGLLTGRVENTFNQSIDTSFYTIPPQAVAGSGRFRRLTFDLALGAEISLAAGFFLFSELKTWLPASNFPSPYLFNNKTPRVLLLNGGVRILFD